MKKKCRAALRDEKGDIINSSSSIVTRESLLSSKVRLIMENIQYYNQRGNMWVGKLTLRNA
jgi:hypothetical protein